MLKIVIAGACALALLAAVGEAADETLKGDAAFGDWRDDRPVVNKSRCPV